MSEKSEENENIKKEIKKDEIYRNEDDEVAGYSFSRSFWKERKLRTIKVELAECIDDGGGGISK